MPEAPKYSMLIQWSEVDQTFVVVLPDFIGRVYQPVTDGATYEEAARMGAEVLELLVETEETLPATSYWQTKAD